MSFEYGDIVKVNLNPTKGHEQANFRPVLVINSVPILGGLNIVCPITSSDIDYPLKVTLDGRTMTHGTIMCFQIRTLDLNIRDTRFIEKAPDDIVARCAEYIQRLTIPIDETI